MAKDYLVITLIAGSILMTLFVFYITIFMVIYKNRARRHTMEKKELHLTFQNEILRTRLEVNEESLNQLSQEIHDNVGQLLSVAQANLITLHNKLADDSHRKLLVNTQELVNQSLSDLRNVSHVLNSEFVNHIGLEGSLRKQLEYIRSNEDISFHIEIHGESDNLDAEKEVMIFRIAQEALSNIIKHAHATNIYIFMEYQSDMFVMKIKDNGKGGLQDAELKKKGGIGLINMRQRAKFMNGEFRVINSNLDGTEIELKIPL